MINARVETAAEKPSFRGAWKARRCIVPATGWYEWQVTEAGKQAWLLRRADAPFTPFAGLWESWQDPAGGRILETFTVLTTEAVPELASVHNRMPVVLEPGDFGAWLRAGPPPDRAALGGSRGASAWELTAVSDRVNNARHEGPDCAEPLSL
jgi:putative SOS response-associated peptidase YedK